MKIDQSLDAWYDLLDPDAGYPMAWILDIRYWIEAFGLF